MAEAILVLKIDSEGNLTVVKQAKTELEGLGKKSDTTKDALSRLKDAAKVLAPALIALKVAQTGVEMVQLGAQSMAATDRLVAFSGSAERASMMLEALRSSSDYTIDRMTATAHASRLMQMGMVDSREEMALTGAIVAKLGDQTQSLETRMSTWTMLMANQSTLRLDTFGLSVERVEALMAELEKRGMSTEKAFRTAVFEEGSQALETLGDTTNDLNTKLQILESGVDSIKGEFAVGLASAFAEAIGPGQELAETLERLANAAGAFGAGVGTGFMQQFAPGFGAGLRTDNAALEESLQLHDRWAVKKRETADADRLVAAAQQAAADAAEEYEERLAAQVDMALRVTQIERRRSEALARMSDLEQDIAERYQERLNDIYRMGEKSRTEIVQDAYQERLRALQEAFAAEEAAYQAQKAARRYAEELERLAREHEDRIKQIRDRYRETERQAEDRRYREALAALEESQRERLRILRGGSPEGEFEDEKERLAREHEERMAGLYSEAARERERKRYKEALEALEKEKKEKDLLEEFEKEKEALEREHRKQLEKLSQKEIEENLRREEERYREERRQAEERERERKEELARREDQERREAEARGIIEAWYQGEMSDIQRQEMARRLAQADRDYAHDLAQLEANRVSIEATYSESMNRLVMTEMEGNAQRRLDYAQSNDMILAETLEWQKQMNRILMSTAQYSYETWKYIFEMEKTPPKHWEDLLPPGVWEPPGYQHGTPPGGHRGGMALVGEGDTRGELVVLPRGTQVIDAPNTERLMGGGGPTVLIQNYFGRDAVRSERDIYEISQDQEMMMRRRGIRTITTT